MLVLGVAHRRPQGEVLLNLVVSESGYKDVECRSILRLLVLVSPRVVILEIQVLLVYIQILRRVIFFGFGATFELHRHVRNSNRCVSHRCGSVASLCPFYLCINRTSLRIFSLCCFKRHLRSLPA